MRVLWCTFLLPLTSYMRFYMRENRQEITKQTHILWEEKKESSFAVVLTRFKFTRLPAKPGVGEKEPIKSRCHLCLLSVVSGSFAENPYIPLEWRLPGRIEFRFERKSSSKAFQHIIYICEGFCDENYFPHISQVLLPEDTKELVTRFRTLHRPITRLQALNGFPAAATVNLFIVIPRSNVFVKLSKHVPRRPHTSEKDECSKETNEDTSTFKCSFEYVGADWVLFLLIANTPVKSDTCAITMFFHALDLAWCDVNQMANTENHNNFLHSN